MVRASRSHHDRDPIHELPESELIAAERFLHYCRATADPVLRGLLEAPPDDEPEAAAERRAVHEAREELARGRSGRWRGAARVGPVSGTVVLTTSAQRDLRRLDRPVATRILDSLARNCSVCRPP